MGIGKGTAETVKDWLAIEGKRKTEQGGKTTTETAIRSEAALRQSRTGVEKEEDEG